jgi:hypothetical protein
VWERYGQLAKKIIDRAVGAHGTLRIEHEVPIADAQSGDVYFVPEPGKDAERALLGWLGRITCEPCLLEMLQRTPGPVDTRKRDTLLLRLLGRGRVLQEAVEDLKALPRDAPEREVAMPPLVALRFEVKEDPEADDEARDFLMATRDLYEEWEIRVKAEGRAEGKAEGLVSSLVAAYETRFGAMPQTLRKALAKVVDPALTSLWMGLFITASAKEIAAAVRQGKPR